MIIRLASVPHNMTKEEDNYTSATPIKQNKNNGINNKRRIKKENNGIKRKYGVDKNNGINKK